MQYISCEIIIQRCLCVCVEDETCVNTKVNFNMVNVLYLFIIKKCKLRFRANASFMIYQLNMTTHVTSKYGHMVIPDANQIHLCRHSTIHTYPNIFTFGQCKQAALIARIPSAPMLHDRKLQHKELRSVANINTDSTH